MLSARICGVEMAKKQRANHVTASFHYLVKRERGAPDSDEVGFTAAEFAKLCTRLRDVTPINFDDEAEIRRIKVGEKSPFCNALTYRRNESLAGLRVRTTVRSIAIPDTEPLMPRA
jgi:hypothetical protein